MAERLDNKNIIADNYLLINPLVFHRFRSGGKTMRSHSDMLKIAMFRRNKLCDTREEVKSFHQLLFSLDTTTINSLSLIDRLIDGEFLNSVANIGVSTDSCTDWWENSTFLPSWEFLLYSPKFTRRILRTILNILDEFLTKDLSICVIIFLLPDFKRNFKIDKPFQSREFWQRWQCSSCNQKFCDQNDEGCAEKFITNLLLSLTSSKSLY